MADDNEIINILKNANPRELMDMCRENHAYSRVCRENKATIFQHVLDKYNVNYVRANSLIYLQSFDSVEEEEIYYDHHRFKRPDGTYKFGEIFEKYYRWYVKDHIVIGENIEHVPSLPNVRYFTLKNNRELREISGDFASLVHLKCYDSVVQRIRGNFPNLTVLECQSSHIQEIPQMPSLTRLNISETPIRELNLSSSQQLRTLDARNMYHLRRLVLNSSVYLNLDMVYNDDGSSPNVIYRTSNSRAQLPSGQSQPTTQSQPTYSRPSTQSQSTYSRQSQPSDYWRLREAESDYSSDSESDYSGESDSEPEYSRTESMYSSQSQPSSQSRSTSSTIPEEDQYDYQNKRPTPVTHVSGVQDCVNPNLISLEDYTNEDDPVIIYTLNSQGEFNKAICLTKQEMTTYLSVMLGDSFPENILAIYEMTHTPTKRVLIKLPINNMLLTMGSVMKMMNSRNRTWYAMPLYGGKRRRVGSISGVFGRFGQIPGEVIYKLYTRDQINARTEAREEAEDYPSTNMNNNDINRYLRDIISSILSQGQSRYQEFESDDSSWF